MKAKLKLISDLFGEFEPAEYSPKEIDIFHVSLLLGIGANENDSIDYFDVFVCTPKWIDLNERKPILLRNTIVVEDYNFKEIIRYINSFIDSCDGNDWEEIAHKLSKLFRWEFDDYK
ncbi:hypothetical protein A1D23_13320 [Chelonobacter oris]|uniref:Imm8 family immunity protein n=1 Tax=Chelonobacter oris TaxID=505317 RepID=UPI0024485F3E|nr:Imm8 family immunity protein [Chelonobacter oris]MDH3001565.1 hypothetical protein [Chelonobacter oris]